MVPFPIAVGIGLSALFVSIGLYDVVSNFMEVKHKKDLANAELSKARQAYETACLLQTK
jgi:uncharacterized protein with GYD domain